MTSLTSSLTVKLIDDVSRPARSVAQALKQAERNVKDVAKAMSGTGATDKFVRDLSKIRLSAKDIETVAGAWRDYSKSAGLAAKASDWTKAQAAGVRAWERSTLQSLRAVKREQIAFNKEMRVGSGVSPMMLAMSQSTMANKRMIDGMLKSGARKVPAVAAASEIGAAELAAAGGLLGRVGIGHVASGYAAYHGARHALVSGASYQHAVTALQNIGLTLEEMEHVKKTAQEVARRAPGTSATEALDQIRETIGAFGSLEHAVEHAATLAQINSVLAAAGRDKITSSPENAQNFVRYFEERGVAGDAHRFTREAKEQARAMAFFGEKYNPGEMLQFAQQAKAALIPYNERFATKIVPSLVTMLGGPRAGTAANMWNKTIMGRVNDKLQAQEWLRLGLLDPKQVIMKQGHAVAWKPGAVKNTDLAMRDPLAWTEEVLLTAMQKRGIDINSLLELQKENALLYRNSSANVFASDLSLPMSRQRLHKDEALQNRVGSFDEIFARNQSQDATVAWGNLKTSIENLGAAATSALPVAQVLNALSTQINNVAEGGPAKWWNEKVVPGWSRVGAEAMSGATNWWNKYTGAPGAFSPPAPAASRPAAFTQIEGATPHVDTSQIDAAKISADQAKGAIEGLNVSVAPSVSTGSLSEALNLARAVNAELSRIGANAAGAVGQIGRLNAAAASVKLPTFAQINRTSFSAAGDPAGK